MIDGKIVLAIIPARGGSKGIPRKNIKNLAGKPLIAWTIDEAKKSKYIDRLILSSEDAEIIQVAKEWGCEVPFVRPHELAEDETGSVAVVLHALQNLTTEYDYVVLLQPTSPLRRVEHIDEAIEQLILAGASSSVSIMEAEANPYWMYRLSPTAGIISPFVEGESEVIRRQDLPPIYQLNGAIYIIKSATFLKEKKFVLADTIGYIMDQEASLDIDTMIDFKLAEIMLNDYCNTKN